MKPVHNKSGGNFADIGDFGQVFNTGSHKRVQIFKMRGQHLCCLLAHLANAKGAEEPCKSGFPAPVNGGDQVGGGFLPHTLKLRHGAGFQIIQICGGLYQAAVDEAFTHGDAQALDVHGLPGGKMGDVAEPLGGTLGACAAQGRAVLVSDHGRAALRADGGQDKGDRPLRALFLVHGEDLGDDLPGLLQQHRVADAKIQPVNIVLIMERGGGDRGTGQADGLHNDLGRQHAGAAHLHHDIHDLALFLLRRVFEGHGPARGFGRAAQGFPLGQGVDFDHRAVHVIGQLSPVLPQPFNALNAVPDIVIAGIGHHGKAHGTHGVQGLGVGLVLLAGAVLQVKADNVQLAGGRHLGVQLAHGACGGVAGIGQQRLTFDLPLRVQLLKNRFGHIYLAPDDQPLRRVFNAQGQRAHGAQIFRHVLAGHAVSPGGAPDENTVFIL